MTPQALICGIVCGDSCEWPWPADGQAEQAFIDEAARQQVDALLAYHLIQTSSIARWPPALVETLRTRLRHLSVREALVQRELVAVLEAFHRASLPVLLMKGSALAYTVYPAPAIRHRDDTDVLIRRPDLEHAASILGELGYERGNVLAGQRVGHQAFFRKTDEHGIVHDLDVHWKTSNRPLFEDILGWEELDAAAVPVPDLGPHARALGTVHALTLACTHPVAHHGNAPQRRLRWVYDVHLLLRTMTEPDFACWVELVTTRNIRAVCAQLLDEAHGHFRSNVPGHVTDALSHATGEPSAQYLSAGPWRGDVRLSDLRTTRGLRAKTQLLREVILPAPAYMRRAYGVTTSLPLAPLYIHRLVRGSWRLLRRLASGAPGQGARPS